jgi:hypothetical protein
MSWSDTIVRHVGRAAGWAAASCLTVMASIALAAGVMKPDAPVVTWDAHAGPAEIPETISEGYVVLEVRADQNARSTLTMMRLAEGVELEELRAALREIDAAFTAGEDPVPAINAALELADVVAEVEAEPGTQGRVGMVLTPGRYVLEHTPEADDPDLVVDERAYHELTVEGPAAASPPEADVTVQMVDFAFAFPPDLDAGMQVWHVVNRGQQIHHIAIFSLPEPMTPEEFFGLMEEGEGGVVPAAYIGIKSSGEESYHEVHLEDGHYMAVCFLPDHLGEATGMPHFALGMVQPFTVGQP